MNKPLTIKTRDLEDLSTQAMSLWYTLMAFPGVCPADDGVGARQVRGAKALVELCDKIAAYNDSKFKRTSIDELMEAVR